MNLFIMSCCPFPPLGLGSHATFSFLGPCPSHLLYVVGWEHPSLAVHLCDGPVLIDFGSHVEDVAQHKRYFIGVLCVVALLHSDFVRLHRTSPERIVFIAAEVFRNRRTHGTADRVIVSQGQPCREVTRLTDLVVAED